VGEALARREALALAEEPEPLLAANRHDRVQRGRVLRRKTEAFEGIVQVQALGERQPGVTIGQVSTPTKVRSRSESLSRPPFRVWSLRCQ
jgi:hypothetical protein